MHFDRNSEGNPHIPIAKTVITWQAYMSETSVDVLLVRGAPGVGKSSATRALRKLIPHGAIVEVDHVRGMIASVRWVDTGQHLVALGVTLGIVRSFLQENFRPIIVVDTFSRGKLKAFAERLSAELGARYRTASLYADPDVLLARVNGRPHNEFREPEASTMLNREVFNNRYDFEELIDTTNLTPAEIASQLLDVLEKPL